ncbi:hypothetical protein GCM10020219_059410 [Nonomuraea dietziae]
MRAEHADGTAGLHEQGLVALQRGERADKRVERGPVTRGLAGTAVDDQLLGVLGDFRVQVVLEHPERGLLRPALGGERGASRRAHGAAHA